MDEHDNKTGSQKQGGWTPGPWSLQARMGPAGRTAFGNGTQIVSGDTHVASVSSPADKPLDQKMSDARLIAAAPDLYAALEAARGELAQIAMHKTLTFPAAPHVLAGMADRSLARIDAALSRANPSTDQGGE